MAPVVSTSKVAEEMGMITINLISNVTLNYASILSNQKLYFFRHPGDNPFYSNIDSMPDIRPRRKSIPLVSELVSIFFIYSVSINYLKMELINLFIFLAGFNWLSYFYLMKSYYFVLEGFIVSSFDQLNLKAGKRAYKILWKRISIDFNVLRKCHWCGS